MSLLTNLIAHWRLNEASGTREDAHAANDLSDNNTVLSAAGKLGDAAAFTAAAEEYLSLGDNADLSTGDIGFTWAGWARLGDKSVQRPIVCKFTQDLATCEYYLYYDAAIDRWMFSVSDGTSQGDVVAANLGSPSVDTWYFLLAWHDPTGNQLGIEVNGVSETPTSWSNGVQDSTTDLAIGAYPAAGVYLEGRVDSLSFWKRVLTSGERSQLYNGGNGLDYPFATSVRPREPRIVRPPFPYFLVNQ